MRVEIRYKIFFSLFEEMNSGWVWIGTPKVNQRAIIKITNKENGKKIYCEALLIDNNFLNKYNNVPRIFIENSDNPIVINEWYRKKLGNIEAQSEYDLEIEEKDNLWGKLRACSHHPQIIVRTSTWLCIISAILGLLGLFLGIISLIK